MMQIARSDGRRGTSWHDVPQNVPYRREHEERRFVRLLSTLPHHALPRSNINRSCPPYIAPNQLDTSQQNRRGRLFPTNLFSRLSAGARSELVKRWQQDTEAPGSL